MALQLVFREYGSLTKHFFFTILLNTFKLLAYGMYLCMRLYRPRQRFSSFKLSCNLSGRLLLLILNRYHYQYHHRRLIKTQELIEMLKHETIFCKTRSILVSYADLGPSCVVLLLPQVVTNMQSHVTCF
jgi:hypothetical protein